MANPQHLCQFASTWRGALPLAGTIAECKFHGYRALYIRNWEGRPGLWTRNGMPIEGVGHILHELAAFERHAGEPMFFDGEFLVDGPDTLAATKAWYERGWKSGEEAGIFHVFDCLSFADWKCGGSDAPWIERKERLQSLSLAVERDQAHQWDWRPGSRGRDEGRSPVRVVPHRDIWCVDDVIETVTAIWDAGLEGCILKDIWAPYVRKRSNAWMKVGQPWQAKLRYKRSANPDRSSHHSPI